MITFGASKRMEQLQRCYCYGSGTDTSAYAQAVADTKTQAINQGKSAIDAIFGGGSYGVNAATSYDPKATYYDASGNVFNINKDDTGFSNYVKTYYPDSSSQKDLQYQSAKSWIDTYNKVVDKYGKAAADSALGMMGSSSQARGASSDWANLVKGAGGTYTLGQSDAFSSYDQANNIYQNLLSGYGNYLASSGRLYTGTGTTGGFNDAFYQKRATDYVNYALPQLATQEQKTERDLAYNMANRGLLNSGVYNSLLSSLAKEVNTQKQGIVDTGQSQANTLKSDVASQKSSLYSQLESSADTSAASSLALSQASSLQSPATYQPISNLLSNWANTYLNSLSSTSSSTGSVSPYYYNKSYTSPLPGNTTSG